MKKLLLIVCLALLGSVAYSQNVIQKGNEFVQVPKKEKTASYSLTSYTYTTLDGAKYPIYVSDKGKYFILRTSKNGRKYRQYLKDIQKILEQQNK